MAQEPTEDRLAQAIKTGDGFFTTFFVSSYSPHIVRWCANRGLSPDTITAFSMLLGVLAAALFAWGTQAALILGAIILQVSFTFDCVDGQLARFTHQTSLLGAWLDVSADRTKEFLVYAGLAYGAVRTGADPQIWFLAASAMALQSLRHTVLFSYTQLSNGTVSPGPSGTGIVHWLRMIIPFPIGERFLVISVTAIIWGPEITFAVLIVWGVAALVWTTAGRMRRSMA